MNPDWNLEPVDDDCECEPCLDEGECNEICRCMNEDDWEVYDE